MKKVDFSNLEKISRLDDCKTHICSIKGITVIDKDNFLLNNRASVIEYMQLTCDNLGFFKSIKSLITGRLQLNGKQIENYQDEYFMKMDRNKGYSKVSFEKIYTDID